MNHTFSDKIILLNQATLESLSRKHKFTVVRLFTEAGIKIFEADFGFAWWKFGDNKNYQLAYKSPNIPYQPKGPRMHGGAYKALKSRATLFIKSIKKDRYSNPTVIPYMKNYVVIPIVYKNYKYGTIVLCFKKQHNFSREEKILSRSLGNNAAQAITIFRAEEQHRKLLAQKDEFLSIASHELKTPVTSIKGFTQLLLSRLGKGDSKLKYFLSKIDSQVDKLTRLVAELLDMSKIDSGRLHITKTRFNLSKLAREIIEDLQFTTEKHAITLENKPKIYIKGDSDRVGQVLSNLVTNAIKYSPDGGKITVSIKAKRREAEVAVRDFGIGVPAKYKTKIFQRFFQAGNLGEQAFPGLGLGLFISKQIIDRHGGRIWFRNHKPKGTSFFFTIPLYARE